MSFFFLSRGLGPVAGGVRRIFIAAAGVATLGVALYKIPSWWETWNAVAVVAVGTVAATAFVLAIGLALRGSALAVERATIELSLIACTLLAAEAILLLHAPEEWPDDPLVRRMIVHERAATSQGNVYDARLPSEVVADLRLQGLDAVPGFAESMVTNPAVASALVERDILPLSNAAKALVVECNEGPGYLQFRSDRFGFNNPPGLSAGPIDVAVVGESLALGHCVAPSTSAVDRLRARFPRTANFGVAGARVLSQLGVFREYVEPLEPPVVVWFLNLNFVEPRYESSQPVLLRYLDDASFSQGLRLRQHDVDAFAREVAAPLVLRRDRTLRAQLENPAEFPLARVGKFYELRRLVGFGSATQPTPAAPNLDYFARALEHMSEATAGWDGRLIVLMLPSYALSVRNQRAMARYDAVTKHLRAAEIEVVDGVALFAAEPDFLRLYTLRIDNHPNERGHAVLAEAVIAAIDSKEKP
jgi:hypothetical protein